MAGRYIALIVGLIVLFVAIVAILIRVMPGPLRSTDYLVIGGAATFLCLAAAFVLFVTTIQRGEDTFFKKRKR